MINLVDASIYVWGAAWRGHQIYEFLVKRMGLKILKYIDDNQNLQGSYVEDVEIISAKYFLEKYNTTDSVVIIGTLIPQSEANMARFLSNEGYNGRVIGCADFHEKYEIKFFCENMNPRYDIEYEWKMKNWMNSFLAEVGFWNYDVARPQGAYWKHYEERVAPKEFYCERAMKYLHADSIILDVGCGICTQYGEYWRGKKINITGVDPLAEFYNRINKKYELNYQVGFRIPQVDFGMFELLSYKYGNNYCDLILIDNALDHCIDPVISIIECIKVLKVGGVLSTFHHIDEAYKACYSDLHQWNICCDASGQFILWNNENYINVSEYISEYVEITTEKVNNYTVEMPYGGVICTMKKLKNIPDDFIENQKERVGKVIEMMMHKLASPEYAMEIIKINL